LSTQGNKSISPMGGKKIATRGPEPIVGKPVKGRRKGEANSGKQRPEKSGEGTSHRKILFLTGTPALVCSRVEFLPMWTFLETGCAGQGGSMRSVSEDWGKSALRGEGVFLRWGEKPSVERGLDTDLRGG